MKLNNDGQIALDGIVQNVVTILDLDPTLDGVQLVINQVEDLDVQFWSNRTDGQISLYNYYKSLDVQSLDVFSWVVVLLLDQHN